jgi:hypothetical protein
VTAQSTIRSRQCRNRQREGLVRIGVDIPSEFIWMAIERGYVSEAAALDKRTLSALAGRLLAAWGQGVLSIKSVRPEK